MLTRSSNPTPVPQMVHPCPEFHLASAKSGPNPFRNSLPTSKKSPRSCPEPSPPSETVRAYSGVLKTAQPNKPLGVELMLKCRSCPSGTPGISNTINKIDLIYLAGLGGPWESSVSPTLKGFGRWDLEPSSEE
ncbi:hypothetical protein NMY22_g13023 [Coprinellus aureogranulatus]|nr:hypothetical protein NMY22_g13023 [Coprinellus aureogranulatus]